MTAIASAILAEEAQIDAVAGKAAAAARLLRHAARDFAPAAFSNSLSAEDMVVTDLIVQGGVDIALFTLDTGRLPAETYELLAEAEKRYGRRIQVFTPRHDLLEALVARDGINGFYGSVEARKACCQVRKVEPLGRALAGKKAWVTGLRAEQAVSRGGLKPLVHDETYDLVKVNPLADWTEQDIWLYIRVNRLPYNKLHDRNYPSIGCAPCTRAVAPGEDLRAGRWWWESPESKECGLHVVDGRLQRLEAT